MGYNLRRLLDQYLTEAIKIKFTLWISELISLKFEPVLESVDSHVAFTEYVGSNFGSFGADVWSPSLRQSYFKVLVPIIKRNAESLKHSVSLNSGTTKSLDSKEKNLYCIYLKLKK